MKRTYSEAQRTNNGHANGDRRNGNSMESDDYSGHIEGKQEQKGEPFHHFHFSTYRAKRQGSARVVVEVEGQSSDEDDQEMPQHNARSRTNGNRVRHGTIEVEEDDETPRSPVPKQTKVCTTFEPHQEVDVAGSSRLIHLSPELLAALQAMLDPMVVADQSGNILIFNNAACRLFGYQSREVVGQNVSMLMEEDIAKVHQSYIEKFLNSDRRGPTAVIGTPGREVTARQKDGSLIPVWLTLNYRVIGHHNLFVACMRDLRESKRQQEQIIKSNSRLRSVMKTMLDPMVVCDGRGGILVFNNAAVKLFGYSEEEATGQNVSILMPEDLAAVHDSYLQQYLVTREPHIMGSSREVVAKHKDGSLIPVLLSVSDSSVSNADGIPLDISFTACIHDLRKIKQRELALERANQLLRCAMEVMLDPLVLCDRSGIIVMVNPATCKLFGYTAQELVGTNVAILCEPKHRVVHDTYIQRYLETGQARILGKQSREVVAAKKDGTLFPILLSTSESKGDPHLFVGCVHDLSLVKQREQELSATQKKMAEYTRQIEQAIASSHPPRLSAAFPE